MAERLKQSEEVTKALKEIYDAIAESARLFNTAAEVKAYNPNAAGELVLQGKKLKT